MIRLVDKGRAAGLYRPLLFYQIDNLLDGHYEGFIHKDRIIAKAMYLVMGASADRMNVDFTKYCYSFG